MQTNWLATLGAMVSAIILTTSSALAICSGAAPQTVLQAFKDRGGAAWIAANGRAANVGDQVLALSAQAVNTKDSEFKRPFGDMLGASSNDAGKSIGRSLRRLVTACADPKDPGDTADKLYISENILPFLLSSYSANLAYGEGEGATPAATDGGGGLGSPGGGSSSGSGSTGALAQGGGSNSGETVADDSASTPTAPRTAPTASASGIGSSATSGSDTTASDTNF